MNNSNDSCPNATILTFFCRTARDVSDRLNKSVVTTNSMSTNYYNEIFLIVLNCDIKAYFEMEKVKCKGEDFLNAYITKSINTTIHSTSTTGNNRNEHTVYLRIHI